MLLVIKKHIQNKVRYIVSEIKVEKNTHHILITFMVGQLVYPMNTGLINNSEFPNFSGGKVMKEVSTFFLKSLSRLMSWERVKGELNVFFASYRYEGEKDKEYIERLRILIDRFVEEVEGDNYHL